MRIVIDMQGAQSFGSRSRGIGRYTQSLSQAIVRNKGNHEVLLALSGLFPDTIESIRADFDGHLPQENIRVWYAPAPVSIMVNGNNCNNNWRRKSAELVREAFLASLKPDIVLVTSLFEGLVDDAVTSIGALSINVPTATILYDLIPFIHRQPYLDNPVVEAWYESKLNHLRRADLLLAISESSRQESIRYLGFSEDVSINISTAADPHFQPESIERKKEAEIRDRYNLQRPYVMYTGGIDYRKNIEGLIRAYANLPKELRAQHQLAVVCSTQPQDKIRLEKLANQQGLAQDELVLTGFVPEGDLLALYNLCRIFVFPSWHEGFGLPALEAMSCGRAVIGANTSSVPEVIGHKEALFDPRSDEAIAAKLKQVLTDDDFRIGLEQHGLDQAKNFTWDKCAHHVLAAFENFHEEQKSFLPRKPSLNHRPKMAYVSPLPPERSGISDYSAELLPELSRHYDIDVIVAQDTVSDPWINANCQNRDVEWFRSHSTRYDRVLYHFGNSHFHQHMFNLLEEIPGVIVLHDFFLSGIVAHMDFYGTMPNGWSNELYKAHGYSAVMERFFATDMADVVMKYPCNLSVIRGAQGVIVHSENSWRLVNQWYGHNHLENWAVIPLLKAPVLERDRSKARHALNLNVDDFVICSFGLLSATKLNHRLLNTWLASGLAKDKKCVLVFVGENDGGEYGQDLITTIHRSGLAKRIHITGWADTATFHDYLAAADICVQLRALSRGETSAAVLDCMNYGLPTIVNANGSMADLPDDAVWKMDDEFKDGQLVEALETLWRDTIRREQLGAHAREIIENHHGPHCCANQYFESIESFYRNAATDIHSLTSAVALIDPGPANPEDLVPLAEDMGKSISPSFATRQLLVDVTGLVQSANGNSSQQIVKGILNALLTTPQDGLRVEPVYAVERGYRYARRFTLEFMNCPKGVLNDDLVDYRTGDIFLALDFQPKIITDYRVFYQQMRRHGVNVNFVVYDLLCILMPHFFDFGEDTAELHSRWLKVVAENDGALCISRSVAIELKQWLDNNSPERQRPLKVDWFHLGADVDNSVPSLGCFKDADRVFKDINSRPSFLTVGTIEPRKGQAQTLSAFEQLWAEGVDVNLVIVGKQGWKVDSLIENIRLHPELGRRLFWLEEINDEFLEKIYAASTCLIAPSAGEGFGLPLIKAAQHKKPIIARDIPVFREVAGEHAFYFSGKEPSDLSGALFEWLSLYRENEHPPSDSMPWLTWAESSRQLLKVITGD